MLKKISILLLIIIIVLIGCFSFRNDIVKSVINSYDGKHKINIEDIDIAIFNNNITASKFSAFYPKPNNKHSFFKFNQLGIDANFIELLSKSKYDINLVKINDISINILGTIKNNNFYTIDSIKNQIKEKLVSQNNINKTPSKQDNSHTNTNEKMADIKNPIFINKIKINNVLINFIDPTTAQINDKFKINQITLTNISSNDGYDKIINQITTRILKDLKSKNIFKDVLKEKIDAEKKRIKEKLKTKLELEKQKMREKIAKEKEKLKQKEEKLKEKLLQKLKEKF